MTERRPRASFGLVVGVGLAASGLAAVAAAKPWYAAAVDFKPTPDFQRPETTADMPLALALSLVALAAWGVVLVTRTTGRRIALALAASASAGILVCVVVAVSALPDQLHDQLGEDAADIVGKPTAWFFVAAISAAVALVTAIVGWRAAPTWPSMGAKYDAPTGVPADDTDLWKALDAGHDPTSDPTAGPESNPSPPAP